MKENNTNQNGIRSDASTCSILNLTLHRKWFDMIAAGEKLEEYREMKPYWNTRLNNKSYSAVKFVNGYGAHRPWMIVELHGHLSGLGIERWGAPLGVAVHILRLGRILSSSNVKMNRQPQNHEKR